jgi:lysophospholipase L1-like esterase
MKSRTASITLILLGLLCAALLAEVSLRILGVTYPNFYTLDEHTGGALRPGATGWWLKEGKAYVRINSDGLRDREHSTTKLPNTIRIAVLGDSFAEAMQVPMEKTFWSVMERRLRGCNALKGRNVEVINFGVSGYGTAQELLALRQRVWRYEPDIVVLVFFSGNDVRNNSRTLERNSPKPYFVLENGNLLLDNSFRLSPAFLRRDVLLTKIYRVIAEYSRVLQVVREARDLFRRLSDVSRDQQSAARERGEELPRPSEKESLFDDPGIDTWIFLEPADPAWKEAWEITERLVLTMRDEVREKGAWFLVVSVPGGVEAHPDPSMRQAFMEHIGVKNLDYPHERVKALGERQGFPVVNLAPVFRQRAERHGAFLYGFDGKGRGHWNSEGHQLAGEIIAPNLCETLAGEGQRQAE